MPAFIACDMPDLAALAGAPPYVEGSLRYVFQGTGPQDGAALAQANGLRLNTDKPILDYQAARAEVTGYLESGNGIVSVMRSGLHLQGCLVAAWRALRFADRLRRVRDAPGVLSRTNYTRIERRLDGLKDLRNAIEHMEEKVDDQIGEAALPRLNDRASEFRLLEAVVSTEDLSNLVGGLHELCREASSWNPPRSPAP